MTLAYGVMYAVLVLCFDYNVFRGKVQDPQKIDTAPVVDDEDVLNSTNR